MKVIVINGSPKGNKSVTACYAKYLEKNCDLEFQYLDVGKKIRKIRKSREEASNIADLIRGCDGVIWSTPVYYCTVPSQLMEFISIIEEYGDAFKGKLSTFITTSINFFDNTAGAYLEKVISSFQMEYYKGVNFNMFDITKSRGQEILEVFARDYLITLREKRVIPNRKITVKPVIFNYIPGDLNPIETDKRVVILGDLNDPVSNIYKLINGAKSQFKSPNLEVVDINSIDMKSGCIGCCKCGWDNVCVLGKSDGHNSFFRNYLEKADIIICCPKVKGDFFSHIWKRFFDRNFFVNHAPVLKGKQFGWIISGDVSDKPYILDFIDIWAQNNKSNYAGFISDTNISSEDLSRKLEGYVRRLVRQGEVSYIPPHNFLGVGGSKVFRDEVYGSLKFPFRMDHKVYKKTGYYDFPWKKIGTRLASSIMLRVMMIKPVREKVMDSSIIQDNMFLRASAVLTR